MKIQELLQTTALTELKMSPGSLRTLAARIPGAKVGMEFEMYVPGASDVDGGDFDLDLSMDETIYVEGWRDLVNNVADFFSSGEFADGGTAYFRRQMDGRPNEDYTEWMFSKFYEWARDGAFEEWYAEEYPGDELPEVDSRGWNDAMDRFQEDKMDEFAQEEGSVQDWINDEDIDTYYRFGDRYNFSWPHMTGGGDAAELESIAEDFGKTVGMDVDVSTEYHQKPKSTTAYTVEPDGSLGSAESSNDGGLEFVSPPLSIDQMIDQLNKVKAWADRYGAYTNESCGLHINVSVPGFSLDKLDYVKLALFVGDDWVANQFGRLGSTWAKSSLGQIKEKIKSDPTKIVNYLDVVKKGFADIASRVIHSGRTEKYVTLNTKDNRVEFRAPGGDWLNTDIDKLINTMLRFVVALDIAVHPEKEKKEYVSKLYKLLDGAKVIEDPDTIQAFALRSAGLITNDQLKNELKAKQATRLSKKPVDKKSQLP